MSLRVCRSVERNATYDPLRLLISALTQATRAPVSSCLLQACTARADSNASSAVNRLAAVMAQAHS